MNIKDFLIENYIWILVIILITIVTIIGFLADKKKNGKKNEKQPVQTPNNNIQPANNVAPIQYNNQQLVPNPMNNNANLDMTANNFNNQMTQLNQVNNMQNLNNGNNINTNMTPVEPISTTPVSINTNMINNPSPVENIVPNVNPEPMYQPLSEQKPIFSPRPIPNYDNTQNNNQEMINPIENSLSSNNLNVIPPMGQFNFNQTNQTPEPTQPEPTVNPIPNFNNIQSSMPTPTNNNSMNIPNYGQNNQTIPEPINVIPTPQPVTPQSIMSNVYNNGPVIQPNNYNQQMPQQTINQQQAPAQPNIAANQPINFVYGPQSNNQNM